MDLVVLAGMDVLALVLDADQEAVVADLLQLQEAMVAAENLGLVSQLEAAQIVGHSGVQK